MKSWLSSVFKSAPEILASICDTSTPEFASVKSFINYYSKPSVVHFHSRIVWRSFSSVTVRNRCRPLAFLFLARPACFLSHEIIHTESDPAGMFHCWDCCHGRRLPFIRRFIPNAQCGHSVILFTLRSRHLLVSLQPNICWWETFTCVKLTHKINSNWNYRYYGI